jgi:ABC-2 type transport system permease protein
MNKDTKNKTKKKKSFFSDRRFKYGSAAVVFTVVVVASIIAFNAIFGMLARALLWYSDMTAEQLYGITDASRELLADLSSEDVHIKIIFCTPRDKLEEEYHQKLVHQSALSYEKEFDFVEVEYLDIITNPSSVNKYKTTAATTIKTTNVIIENGSDYRVFAIEAFYTFAESDNRVFAFNGEMKITSAIMQLCYSNPIAYFTVGHGETTTSSQLAGLFELAGYDVRTIDLTKEDIDPSAQVVVINGPKYDFLGVNQETNEIAKIADFLDAYGNLMVFMDANAMGTQEFHELNEFLSEWGISFGKSLIKDVDNSISADGYSLVSEYMTEGMGSSLTTSLRDLETVPKAIVRYTMPIEILWENRSIDQGSRTVSPVLVTSDTAQAYGFENENEIISTGSYNLVTITQDSVYVDNEPYTSYVLAVGTTNFTSQDYLASNAYGNADIIFSAMKAMGREKVPLNIDFRLFEDKSLDITVTQANAWTVVYTAVIPAIVLICGIVVWVRRRHL